MFYKSPKSRTQKQKLNLFFSLLQQGVSFVCGLIVPKMMLHAFGSSAYGATSSIATFLSYVTLLEGGLGAVTRSALYKAFANKSSEQVCAIVTESKRLFRKIALVFIAYILIIALSFKRISNYDAFSQWYSFGLVIVIALSEFAEYYFGISYALLLQADQLNYIIAILRSITTILNTISVVMLVMLHCDILTVKLFSGIVFALQPMLLYIYAKKRYNLTDVNSEKKYLENKNSAIGQHIAWTLHNNTDITVLTLFKGLTYVSVYSVYNMIITQLINVLTAFTTGLEAVFGSMLGNHEIDNLKKTFGYYETLISLMSVTILSVAAVLIVPFIKLYTEGITDAEYIEPVFAIMLLSASLLQCMRTPYANLITAAGRFKETQFGAYGEAIINITSSIFLVIRMGLVGVAIGTVTATMFRQVFYVLYLSKHIIRRSVFEWVKRLAVNAVSCLIIFTVGSYAVSLIVVSDYYRWAAAGVVVTAIASIVSMTINSLVYRQDVKAIVDKGFRSAK